MRNVEYKIAYLREKREQARGAQARRIDAMIAIYVREWRKNGGNLHIAAVNCDGQSRQPQESFQ